MSNVTSHTRARKRARRSLDRVCLWDNAHTHTPTALSQNPYLTSKKREFTSQGSQFPFTHFCHGEALTNKYAKPPSLPSPLYSSTYCSISTMHGVSGKHASSDAAVHLAQHQPVVLVGYPMLTLSMLHDVAGTSTTTTAQSHKQHISHGPDSCETVSPATDVEWGGRYSKVLLPLGKSNP